MRTTKGFSHALTRATLGVSMASVLVAADLSSNVALAATPITMKAGDQVITAMLDDSPTAQDFIKSLPLTLSMKRWGNREYYGKVRQPLSAQGKRQSGFANGDVAYWVPGGSFAVFFNDKVNPDISDLIVFGKVTSDLRAFDALGESLEMRIDVVK